MKHGFQGTLNVNSTVPKGEIKHKMTVRLLWLYSAPGEAVMLSHSKHIRIKCPEEFKRQGSDIALSYNEPKLMNKEAPRLLLVHSKTQALLKIRGLSRHFTTAQRSKT